MNLNSLIRKLELDYNISLHNAENKNLFQMEINNRFTVYIEDIDHGHAFTIYSSLGKIDQDKKASQLYMLLCANYFLQETDGVTVAIDKKNDSIVVFQTISCSHLSYPLFLKHLELFINAVAHLEKKISSVSKEEISHVPLNKINYIKP